MGCISLNKVVYTAALVADGWAGAETLGKQFCDGPIDGPTDRKVAYRVACPRLKWGKWIFKFLIFFSSIIHATNAILSGLSVIIAAYMNWTKQFILILIYIRRNFEHSCERIQRTCPYPWSGMGLLCTYLRRVFCLRLLVHDYVNSYWTNHFSVV